MQPGVPDKPLAPPYQAPYSGGGSGRGCGCFAFGCGGVLLALIALCGVGYYSLFYSNLPLAFMKQALEESGNVKLDGLKGNLSTGFEVASLRFRDDSQRDGEGNQAPWSELSDVRIKYRNGGMFSNSFTVEEIRIGGGTIYGDLKFDSDLRGDLLFDELQEEFSDFQSEFSGTSRGTLAVRSISFTNLKITDPKSGEEFRIDEIRLDDVVIEDGRLVEFGDLVVKADSIELLTERSSTFDNAELERTFKGRLERGLVANLLSDIPFEIELGVWSNGRIATRSRWFDGQVEFDAGVPNEPNRYRLNGFTPADHLRLAGQGIVPTGIHVLLTYKPDRATQLDAVDPTGHLLLGKSRLEQFRLRDEPEQKTGRQYFLAAAVVAGRTVAAEIYPLKRLPLIGVRLRPAGDWTLEETWARTVYGRAYAELDPAEQELVQASLSESERLTRSSGEDDDGRRRRRSRSSRGSSDRERERESRGDPAGGEEEDLGESNPAGNADRDWPSDDSKGDLRQGEGEDSLGELEPAGRDGG